MTNLKEARYHILLLLLVYVVGRLNILFTIDSPILGWRPADLASIAVSYFRNGFHFFYPQVFWGGNGPGYVEMEFPLLPFLTAALYKLFGLHDYLSLVLPYLSGFGLVWVTYRLANHLSGVTAGLIAGLITAVAPTLIMQTTTGLWPDPPMVFFEALGMYLMILWTSNGRWQYLLLGACCCSLAILLKMTALLLGFPLLYLFIKRYGKRWWREPATWVTSSIILLPPILWYSHAYQLYTQYGNTFGILAAGYSKFGDFWLLTDLHFYARTVRRILLYQCTPIGSVGFLYAVWVSVRQKANTVMVVWLLAIALYAIVSARGVNEGHYQYLLPILPVGAVFSGIGFVTLFAKARTRWTLESNQPQKLFLSLLLMLLFGANILWARHSFVADDRKYDLPGWEEKKRTGLILRDMTSPGSLLIVSDTQMDHETPKTSMTPPDIFFFSDRRGWYLSMAWVTEDKIEHLRREGAAYFVVCGQSTLEFKTNHIHLADYLGSRYKVILDGSDGIVYDLKTSPN